MRTARAAQSCKSQYLCTAGRSGLAVACLTAVREFPESNRAVGSCVYRKNHCDLQPWAARAVRTLPAVTRSAQPSTLRGTINEYQLLGWLSNNNNPKFLGSGEVAWFLKFLGSGGRKEKERKEREE